MKQEMFIVLLSVGKSLGHVTVAEEDDRAVTSLLEADGVPAGESFISHAVKLGIALTPGFWARYLQLALATWDKAGKMHALWLPELREIHVQSDNSSTLDSQILDAAAAVLQILASPHDDDTDEDLGEHLHALALASEKAKDPDNAYNLAACALQLGPPPGPQRKAVAEYALSLAVAADRPHQIAVCAAEIAASVAAMAGEAAADRLSVFTACEVAIERLARAPREIAKFVAARLIEVMQPRPWLRSLAAPLLPIVGDAESRKGLAEILGREGWPERVSVGPLTAWAADMKAWFNAMLWEIEIEKDRLALEPVPKTNTAETDPVSWTVRHSSYSRAVPHHRSFLRERRFDLNLLVLTHETTHVLSFLGVIGGALTALRVTALRNEVTIWSNTLGANAQDIQGKISERGVAPLISGTAASLFRAERGVELTLKAQALLDAWTPWFEGLAIFSEIAADPALDPTGIGPVTEVLRNLVDFHPEAGADGIFDDREDIQRQYQAFAAEFEERCSRAIAAEGPLRLYSYLNRKPYYIAGYLAVRMVVSAWRAATGRALHGAEVLTLLLHATRFGTREAIPDLSLQSDAFAKDAVRRMAQWASDLAALPAEMIEDFLAAPGRADGGRAYVWRGRDLTAVDRGAPSVAADQAAPLLELVKEAHAALTSAADAERVGGASAVCRMLMSKCGETIAQYNVTPTGEANIADDAELAQGYINLGSLLPIGRAFAKFWLNNDEPAGNSFLMTQLRTAEAHVETGDPSINGFGFPIDRDEGKELAEHYRRTGIPRLEVARVIDLAGFVIPQPGLHFLAFAYDGGGHLWLQGSSQATDEILRRDPALLRWLTDRVEARLWPSPEARAEVEVIAKGEAGAARTRDWINASPEWQIDETKVPVEPWAHHVHDHAERALDKAVRDRTQRDASRQLLTALSDNQILAEAIVTYRLGLVKKYAAEREELTDALFRTARKPGPDDWIEAHATGLASDGFSVFSKTTRGWDVRPAIPL
jgi:hypothetical protein